ncbi:MAG TPA: hypothetical protein PLC42_07015 [Parachlamydiaceae bacterium]|nr:hypothetical protein [Parachlamydiaceae bacterium]
MEPIGSNNQLVYNQTITKKAVQQQLADAAASKYEGMTVHEAIKTEVGFDGFSVVKIKGKFQHKDESTVIAGFYEAAEKKYFQFDVTWTATVKNQENNEEKTVEFSQAVYTNVEIPKGANIQEFEKAKEHAYDLAKSFELLQHNLVKLENPPKNYKEQIDAVKNNSIILFKKMEENREAPLGSLMKGHRAVNLQPRTLEGIVLSYFSNRVSEAGQNAIFRQSYKHKNVILDPSANTLLARFEAMERSGDHVKLQEEEKQSYINFLKEKGEIYRNAFINHTRAASAELRSVENASKGEEVQGLKRQYQELKDQALEKPGIVGTQNPDLVQKQLEAQRQKQLTQLEKDIFVKAGIPQAEAKLDEMKKLKSDYINIYKQIGSYNSEDLELQEMVAKVDVFENQLHLIDEEIKGAKSFCLAPLVRLVPAAENEAAPEVSQQIARPEELARTAAQQVTIPAEKPKMEFVLEKVETQANIQKGKSLVSTIQDWFTSWRNVPAPPIQTVEATAPQPTSEPSKIYEKAVKNALGELMEKNGAGEEEMKKIEGFSEADAETKLREYFLKEVKDLLNVPDSSYKNALRELMEKNEASEEEMKEIEGLSEANAKAELKKYLSEKARDLLKKHGM